MRPTAGETVYQLEEGDFAWSVDQACGSALWMNINKIIRLPK